MDELKPCPFCGAPAKIERGSDHHGTWFNLGCSRHWGAMPDPDAGCIGGRLFYTEIEKPEAEAIAAWNTRTPATMPDAEIVEMLARALCKTHGTDWHEVCPLEVGGDECDSSTCVAAMDEDHDPLVMRDHYRHQATACLTALRNAGLIGEGR